MGSAIKFKHTDVPRQEGERARLKVVQGPDFGSVYVITGLTASIGRGEENDIVLTDLKASRFHAVIVQDLNGKWQVKDQGSANGILFNSSPTRQAEIKYNDVVTIGETTLEFISADVGTKILTAPARSSAKLQADLKSFQAAKDRVSMTFGKFSGNGNSSASQLAGGAGASKTKSKKPLIYIVGALGLGLLFFSDPDKPAASKSKLKVSGATQDLASFLPSPDFNKAADTLFKDGLREYFDHNYGRARTQFETVLQITPGHVLATLYLENCNKSVEEEVKANLEGGKKSFEAGKFRDSKGHYETIMRLLYRDQANPAYIEARDQFDKVVKAMKSEGDKS
jgi:pSer/pThr/pTyr-binding forkhead associated (FHA) protein